MAGDLCPPTSKEKDFRYFSSALKRGFHEGSEAQGIAGIQVDAPVTLVDQM